MELYGKCGLCADGLPCVDHQRNADDVIAAMEHTRSMQAVSKDDAWILADALLELRDEITEERQQTRFALEEARSRAEIAEAEALALGKRNDQLHVAYIQASNPGADVAGIRKTLAEMRAVEPVKLVPGYCAEHDTPVGFPERPVCPHCAS